MKKLLSLVFTAAIISLFSSCAFHGGYMANSASLGRANFSYVHRHATGSATASYVFGFGGLAKNALIDEAKQNMLQSTPLADNQALANITVNMKGSYFYVYNTVTCTVTADIVEFNNK